MRSETATHTANDGASLFYRRWLPDGDTKPKGVVHIVHGMAEHGARYAHVAEALTAKGLVVYANDHRGHGETARTDADLGYFAAENGFRRVVRDIEAFIE